MSISTLVFLGDTYPLSAGEFFVDDEMRVIAPSCDNLLVFTAAKPISVNFNRYKPGNMEVINFDKNNLLGEKHTSIYRLFSSMCKEEWRFIRHKVPFLYRWKAFKVMYVDMHRAYRLKQYIIAQLARRHIAINECVFYSYWHDYKALAIAMLRQEYPMATCISRAHGWDVFADRSTPAYLPFKSYIVQHLNVTYSISQAGKAYLESYLGIPYENKIKVSHLGKFNHRTPLYNKPDSSIHICSCSNIIPLKRIDKIIEVLYAMHPANITWTHFGTGPMMHAMQQYAMELIPHVHCIWKGVVPNNEILDFYAQNYVDVFINLSDSEGIPVSIMEALSAGIPVLATNVGGTAEAVNEENGFLVEQNADVITIAEIIENHVNSREELRLQKRKNAYHYWHEHYDADKNYSNFIENMLKL